MKYPTVSCAGSTPASGYAARHLAKLGFRTVQSGADADLLLLDVPSFLPDGSLRGGGRIEDLLSQRKPRSVILGGNLHHPALTGSAVMDLLQDETYLCQNAAITAYCALPIAASHLPVTFYKLPVLILGWGRIGKCLSRLLKDSGADVSVAARSASDRALAGALGYTVYAPDVPDTVLPGFRLIYNTVPCPVLTEEQTAICNNAVLIDLASQRGILGKEVIWAKGLPGVHAPESSGILIAETVCRLLKEDLK